MNRIIQMGHRDKPTVTPDPTPTVGNPSVATLPGKACAVCGVYVLDAALHDGYHRQQQRWMRRADQLLNLFRQVAEARGWIVPSTGNSRKGSSR
ncbi:hypothetical protein NONO_c73300 [Nocardia nova SH22a]|uniref:Uncharacterized protein n=1 Tax=Nocardia nova SH22a TaxID=1415166 RepID=W5TXY3_9NOCA|nr:hypothetical protein [Nocardia nova]AHH22086.1 hypothetical protein NONO_c73300 [Nocardia nova SH22a]